jgi:glucose/arabinose dehydrogenase/type 1 glutamine amidotransferase
MVRGFVSALLVTLAAGVLPAASVATAESSASFDILVFSRTEGFRHDSIPAGVDALRALGAANGFGVDATEDPAAFTDANLAQYEVVVWILTSGDVLDPEHQEAFERYIQGGGGFVGILSAASTESTWPWYVDLVGAVAEGHPGVVHGEIAVTDRFHPSTAGLPAVWERTDEWHDYQGTPRGDVHVLATVDETTYSGGTDGFDHPIAWCLDYDGGRSWYTGGGHTSEAYSEPLFMQHILGGLQWAAGMLPGDCGATVWDNFQKVTLDEDTEEPFELDVASDGRVFFIERPGRLKIYKPGIGDTVLSGTIPVYSDFEDGLLGLALDPRFAQNRWLYLYYAAPGDFPCALADVGATSCGQSRISRFRVDGDTLILSSEKILLEIPTQRHDGYHSAGSLDFDSAGNLYLSTGDNTSPFESDGYAPIDERADRGPWDAQRTAANTNDLRGKLLRIHPEPNGTYTIPLGNLFPPGTPNTRPEIYAMGFRNPFRFAVDAERGWVYLGDYGPDAVADDVGRGPRGYVEWNLIKSAGNYGWPYCVGPNIPYEDYDFVTDTSSGKFECGSPDNGSPHNTGLSDLPAARPGTMWYSYAESAEFPEMGVGCGCPMGGPVYHYDPWLNSARKFPAYYDDTPFFYEWGRKYLKEIKLHSGEILDINSFLPAVEFKRPMDVTFGPDGAMYILEWGSGFFGNTDSGLYRIDYLNNPPFVPPGGGNGGASNGGSNGGKDGGKDGEMGSSGGDNGKPRLSCTPSPTSLRPSGRKLRKVSVDVEVVDAGAGRASFVLERVWSNPPAAARDIRGWKAGTPDTTGRLRAKGDRVYKLEYSVSDRVGSSDLCLARVSVSRGQDAG